MATGQNGNGSGGRRVLSIEQRPDGVAIVRMDVPGETMNTLQANFAEEFVQVFDDLDKASEVRAVVFTSGKPDSFIAGADVRMIKAVKTAAEAAELSRTGQRAMARVEAFRAPVVAAIHGACLGGGLETALACHARIASDDKKTKLGLPEVQLGLLPAAAGTQRLPRLVGVQAALDLMLTGKQIDGRRARRMGLVENPLGRKLLFDQAKKQLLAKTRGNYPAAERILEVVKAGLEGGFEQGLEAEAQAFGELAVSPEAAMLMSIFTATVELKKDRRAGCGVDGRRHRLRHDPPGQDPRATEGPR